MISNVFYSDEGHEIKAIWKPGGNLTRFKPLTQAYGICFTKNGRVLIVKDAKDWLLPGGTIEKGETPEQALIRELDEEANIDALCCKPLGAQELHYPQNQNKKIGTKFYQSRWVAVISRIKKRAPDPCYGRTFRRKFIKPPEFNRYIRWGAVHREVFRLAHKAFLNWKKTGKL